MLARNGRKREQEALVYRRYCRVARPRVIITGRKGESGSAGPQSATTALGRSTQAIPHYLPLSERAPKLIRNERIGMLNKTRGRSG